VVDHHPCDLAFEGAYGGVSKLAFDAVERVALAVAVLIGLAALVRPRCASVVLQP
jgi:hypothetical protein